MKGQTHDLTEIQGAIKAVQTEIADRQPCNSPCREAGLWREVAVRSMWCAVKLAGMLQEQATQNRTLAQKNTHLECTARQSQKVIKELNARANGIQNVPASEPKRAGRRGRPPGQPATINKRPQDIDRTETIDTDRCPDCGGHDLSHVTNEYDRVVREQRVISENVRYVIKRRYCRDCKRQVRAGIRGVAPHARVSTNHSAAVVALNMSGLSHGKAARFSAEALNSKVSRSWSYRNKAATARRMEPEYDHIRRAILDEPYLQCDEFHWPVPGGKSGLKGGHVLMARGRTYCLAGVSGNRAIDTLKEFLPGYGGTVGQDSYAGWLHIGRFRQMCIIHQKRIAKNDLKYNNPQGNVKTFLERISRLCSRYMEADAIKDPCTRRVAATCLDRMMSDLMHGNWEDDRDRTINRYRKRWRREGLFMSTFLHVDGIDSSNNGVERINRGFVSIRGDGGGNRSEEGMRVNSILFSIYATCRVQKKSFYRHLI